MFILFAVIGFILGANILIYYPLIFIPLSIIFFIAIYKSAKLKGLIYGASSFLLALLVSSIFNNLTPPKEQTSFSGIIIEAKDNYYVLYSFPYKFYVYEKENDVEIGDILKLDSSYYTYTQTTYESQFDFSSYLESKGIRYELNSDKKEVLFQNFFAFKKIRRNFLNNFEGDTKDLLDALIFGNKNYNSHVIELASSLNIIYLFSTSGIYLSLILRGGKFITSKFSKNNKVGEIIPFIVLLPYLPFIFTKIGIIRVVLTYLLRYLNHNFFKKKIDNLTLISFVGLFILLMDYTASYQMGFYLGFFLSCLINCSGDITKRFKKKKYAFTILPIIIYFFMLPISSFQNNEFHIFQLLFQNLVLPLNGIYFITGLLSLFSVPFTHVLPFMSNILISSYKVIHLVDYSISLGEFNAYLIAIYYVLYFYFLINFEAFKRRKYISAVFIMTLLILIKGIPFRPYLYNAVYFINVGQGDSILIQNHNNTVLIDTGGNINFDMAKETLIPFFKKKQIKKIDALITTHNDYDHAGAAPSLIQNFRVGKYLNKKEDFPYKVGDIYLENLNDMNGKDENDSSLVFNLHFMNKYFLLTGDAGIDVEKYLIKKYPDLDCDILKAGHHGSDTSSCEEFIKKVTPSEAIISCGRKNSYKHPKASVIKTLEKYNVKIRYTMEEGTIAYYSLFT